MKQLVKSCKNNPTRCRSIDGKARERPNTHTHTHTQSYSHTNGCFHSLRSVRIDTLSKKRVETDTRSSQKGKRWGNVFSERNPLPEPSRTCAGWVRVVPGMRGFLSLNLSPKCAGCRCERFSLFRSYFCTTVQKSHCCTIMFRSFEFQPFQATYLKTNDVRSAIVLQLLLKLSKSGKRTSLSVL